MEKYSVTIKGVSPLLQNRFNIDSFDAEWVEKKAVDPAQKDVIRKLYVNANGEICQPAIHIEKAMADAAKKIKMKGNRKATYSKIFGSMVTVSPELVPHKNQLYSINLSTTVNPATGGRNICYRPMIENWSLEFSVSFEDEIPPDIVKQALIFAGKYSGLGDWRPQKGGKFGKFEVILFEKKS